MSQFGKIRAEQQKIFINTGLIYGIQSFGVSPNYGNVGVNYVGVGNRDITQTNNSYQYADLSLEALLVGDDYFIQQTGNSPLNSFIMNGNSDTSPYSLISGYLTSYSCKFSENQIPRTAANFRFYKNVGNISTGSLDSNSFSMLTGIYGNNYQSFNGNIANSNIINLSINEYTGNRISEFSLRIDFNRFPIYNVGYPPFKRADLIFPISVACDITFEADPSFSDFNLLDFPYNKIKQNIYIEAYSHLNNNLMCSYRLNNATMVSNQRGLNVDGNLTINRRYIGQIFSFNDLLSGFNSLDFGFVASGINYFIDWGFVSASYSSGIDFGSV